MFRLLSASHHQALHNFPNQNLKKCYSWWDQTTTPLQMAPNTASSDRLSIYRHSSVSESEDQLGKQICCEGSHIRLNCVAPYYVRYNILHFFCHLTNKTESRNDRQSWCDETRSICSLKNPPSSLTVPHCTLRNTLKQNTS
jgi:hypothetical protein